MRRTSAVGAAIGTSAGHSIATPAAIAAVDPSWLPFAEQATVQVQHPSSSTQSWFRSWWISSPLGAETRACQ
jgi:hypothetical protein